MYRPSANIAMEYYDSDYNEEPYDDMDEITAMVEELANLHFETGRVLRRLEQLTGLDGHEPTVPVNGNVVPPDDANTVPARSSAAPAVDNTVIYDSKMFKDKQCVKLRKWTLGPQRNKIGKVLRTTAARVHVTMANGTTIQRAPQNLIRISDEEYKRLLRL
jgi:hypothetical protein